MPRYKPHAKLVGGTPFLLFISIFIIKATCYIRNMIYCVNCKTFSVSSQTYLSDFNEKTQEAQNTGGSYTVKPDFLWENLN